MFRLLAHSGSPVSGISVADLLQWKILVAAGLAPLFYTFYVTIIIFFHKYHYLYGFLDNFGSFKMAISSYAILALMTYASLVFGEQGMDLLKSFYPLVLSLISRSSRVETLKEDRCILVQEVRDIVHRFGWELFPDCEDIKRRRGRGPLSLYARISPEVDLEDLAGLDDFV